MDRYSADLTPDQFEEAIHDIVRRMGGTLSEFSIHRREKLSAAGGTYEFDSTARFEALGVNFLILIECKHHKAPVKRDHVQILQDRIRSMGAQKGLLFSTSPFQSGAVLYAQTHGIALIQVMDGSFNYITKAADPNGPRKLGPPYAASLATGATKSESRGSGSVSYRNLDHYGAKAVLEFWEGKEPTDT